MTLELERLDVAWLATVVDQPDGPGAYVDPATGVAFLCHDHEVTDADGEIVDDPDERGWIPIGGDGSHAAYHDMELFTGLVDDPTVRHRLEEALRGRGPFRKFKDALHRALGEVTRAWYRYAEGRAELRVLDWVLEHELVAEAEVRAAQRVLQERLEAVLAEVSRRPSPGRVGWPSSPSRGHRRWWRDSTTTRSRWSSSRASSSGTPTTTPTSCSSSSTAG